MFNFRNKAVRQEIPSDKATLKDIINNPNYDKYLELLKTDLSYEEKMFRICNMFNMTRFKILTDRGLFIYKDKYVKINLNKNNLTLDEIKCKSYLVNRHNLLLANILYPIEEVSEDGNIAICPSVKGNDNISTEDYMAIQTVLVKNRINLVNAKSRSNYLVDNDKLYLLEYFDFSI